MPIPAIFGGFGRLPEFRQAAASECGLACLAMVASYYGRQSDLRPLIRRAKRRLSSNLSQAV